MDSLEGLEVIASGIGGNVLAELRYKEYLLAVTGPVDLVVAETCGTFARYHLDQDELIAQGSEAVTSLEAYISLDDPRVVHRQRVEET